VFNGLQGSAMFKQKMLRATQVPMQEFICDLRFRHLKVWKLIFHVLAQLTRKQSRITSGVGVLRVVLEVLHFLSPPTCTRIWINMC
jgi:hypothetical protein